MAMQNFNSGVVKIYSVDNAAAAGDLPKEKLVFQHRLRYHERTVGLSRHFSALQAGVKVKHVLRCPLLRDVSTQDIAIPNDGKQYSIVMVQYPENVMPPVMDLTLELSEKIYKVEGTP